MSIFVLGSYVHANCLTMERLPLAGESAYATGLLVEHGGKGLNLAVAIHRLGVEVEALIGIGEDTAADDLIRFMQGQGLSTRWLIKVGGQSGYGVGFIAADGNNCLAVYPGANALLTPAHVADAFGALAAAEIVCAQFEITDPPILAAFRQARSLGIPTLLNPSPWRGLGQELLALTDIVVVNETEAAALFARSLDQSGSPEYWLSLLQDYDWPGELLVVTLAEQGCVAWHQGKTLYQPAWAVDAVDATGAGDAFSAGLAVALGQGRSVQDALAIACACGAWVAARLGVLQVLPTAAQISGFMQTPI